jgi:beta-N-acetylhexosaminidase
MSLPLNGRIEWMDVELRAAARVVAGRVAPRGRLPVPVPVQWADGPAQVLYPIGHGLSYQTYVAHRAHHPT